MDDIVDFIRESNRIEGIVRVPTDVEIKAHQRFLSRPHVTVADLQTFVWDIARARLRDQTGMNVRVGSHVPMKGGPAVRKELSNILRRVIEGDLSSFEAHIRYETLHPFMDGNGRSGRALWAWQMQRLGFYPFELSFLHCFYYQTLSAIGR